MSQYNYSVADDFQSGIDPAQFASEIRASAIVPELVEVRKFGDDVTIIFVSALSIPTEEDLLDALVVAHIPRQSTVPSDEEEQTIDTDGYCTIGVQTAGKDYGTLYQRYQINNDNGTVIFSSSKETGVTQSAGGNSIVLKADSNATDDYYKSWWIKITSGTGIDQVRHITEYDGTSKEATVSDWTIIPDNTSNYALYDRSYVGMIYDESADKFILGYSATVPDLDYTQTDRTDLELKDLEINGNTTVGSDNTNTVTLNSTLSSSVIPTTSNAVDLGSSSNKWRKLYLSGDLEVDGEVNATQLQGVSITNTAPADGQVITYNSSTGNYELDYYYDEDKTVMFFDDFIGANLTLSWAKKDSGGTVTLEDALGGQLKVACNATTSDTIQVFTVRKIAKLDAEFRLKVRAKLSSNVNTIAQFGLFIDSSNYIDFYYDAAGAASTWQGRTKNSGTETSTNTTISGDTSWHIFEMRSSASDVKFYIDGTLRGTNTANLNNNVMYIYIQQTAKNDTAKHLLVDFVRYRSDRDGNIAGSGGGGGSCMLL